MFGYLIDVLGVAVQRLIVNGLRYFCCFINTVYFPKLSIMKN